MKIKKLVSVILSSVLVISSACTAASAVKTDKTGFVHADGRNIIGTDGEKLLIKGMALGNSVWSNPSVPNYNHHTEETYKELSAMGFNSVRFYINYGLFENDRNPYSYNEKGFEWIDKNIKWAKKYGMGIILNMHYPQGGFQSQGNGMELWTDSENQERLIKLWSVIAERYSDEPTVWGYGLINEPYVPLKSTMDETAGQYFDFASLLVSEIRKVSPEQAIFVECLCNTKDIEGKNNYPDWSWFVPENKFPEIDDDNIIYEFHCYDPFYFTHQNADWASTGGITSSYPSDMIASADYIESWSGCIRGKKKQTDNGWSYFETDIASCNAKYNIAAAALHAPSAGKGSVFFDDVSVIEISPDGKRSVKYSYNFNGGTSEFTSWSYDGTGEMLYSENGRNDSGCIEIKGSQSDFVASAQHFELKKGCKYMVSGYIRTENTDSSPSVRLDFAHAKNIEYFDRDYLENIIRSYAEFSENKNVPLYMGEFGVIAAGFNEGRNGEEWVSDMIELCMEYDIGFNYHAYHEESFGFYLNPSDRPAAKKNRALEKVFYDKLSESGEDND